MIDSIDFCDEDLYDLLTNASEISQLSNPNSYARLFVTDDKTGVIKLFDGTIETGKSSVTAKISFRGNGAKNLRNLQLISSRLCAADYPWLALPRKMVFYRNCLVGYIMSFYQGRELCDVLEDSSISFDKKVELFNKLAAHISSLPKDIFAGDLHSHNIIVQENGDVVLVDVDGFSVKGGWRLTTPLSRCENLPEKYYDRSGDILISRNTDILCLFCLFFSFFFDGRDILSFPKYWKDMLPKYFSQIGASSLLTSAITKLFLEEDNLLPENPFSSVRGCLHSDRYQQFLRSTGLDKEENDAASMLDNLIASR